MLYSLSVSFSEECFQSLELTFRGWGVCVCLCVCVCVLVVLCYSLVESNHHELFGLKNHLEFCLQGDVVSVVHFGFLLQLCRFCVCL